MTNPTDGIITSREQIQPTKPQVSTIKKLYNEKVISDTVVEKIVYLSDSLHINGYLARPKDDDGSHPVLIWNRGGSGDKGALDNLTAYLILASTAVWGYVVLATHYRGNKGSEGEEDWGGAEVNDALNLIKVAENIPQADISRIAVEGASRGGITTFRSLIKYDKFKCAIVHAGITDANAICQEKKSFREYLNRQFGGLCDEDRRKELNQRSVVHFVDKLPEDVPILIMHGNKDTVVPIDQSKKLVKLLDKNKIPHEFHILKEGTHVALKDGSYKEIDKLRQAWLEKYLKDPSD